MDIKEGSLPVKYLGVSLSLKQLQVSHCRALIEKVKNAVQGWASKSLSYAGRIELIQRVAMGIIGYWAQQIVLPKKVMKELDQIIRNYIWGSQGRGGKKVKWEDVCKPKEEGGIGLKNCVEWNKLLTYRHFWAIEKKQESLWVRWVHSRFMKMETSVWTCKITMDMVWSLKKILKLKESAMLMLDIRMGDGRGTLFWHDPWFEDLPIILKEEFTRVRIRRDCQLATVRDIKDGEFNSLLRRIPEGTRILNHINSLQFIENRDARVWKVENGGKFVSNYAWDCIRSRGDQVGWFHCVWSSKIIPRHQFIMWLLFRKRLATRDRISRYMEIPDSNCVLCHGALETMDHLFGCCTFALNLWSRFSKSMELVSYPTEWNKIKELAIVKAKGNRFVSNVFKCGFASLVYHIWAERNARIFTRIRRSMEEVWKDITFDSNSLIRKWRRIPMCEQNWALCKNWGISFDEVTQFGQFKAR